MSQPNDEFYVGYLPVPPAQRRFVVVVCVLLLILTGSVAALAAISQREAGAGFWDTATPRAWEGTVRLDPYPMLIVEPGGLEPAGRVFVVQMGKVGAQEPLAGFGDARVRVEGYQLERDGRRIIELAPDAAVVRLGGAQLPVPPEQQLGEVTLDGEIVDYKCFLGAMKPGDGKGHKACATLCIRGGIPPMFVTRGADGMPTYTLLVDSQGDPEIDSFIDYAGEPVSLTGVLVQRGDLRMIRVSPGGVTRR